MYVQTILDVHKKYNALVMSAFNNDAGFVAALDKVILFIGAFNFNLLRNGNTVRWQVRIPVMSRPSAREVGVTHCPSPLSCSVVSSS